MRVRLLPCWPDPASVVSGVLFLLRYLLSEASQCMLLPHVTLIGVLCVGVVVAGFEREHGRPRLHVTHSISAVRRLFQDT
jgi:hypothetical protein